MVTSVLPIYLVATLGLTPFAFGFVDGLYQGASALVRLIGGVAADRWRRYKEVAAAGYAFSAISKLGFLLAGSAWPALAATVLLIGPARAYAPRRAMRSLH